MIREYDSIVRFSFLLPRRAAAAKGSDKRELAAYFVSFTGKVTIYLKSPDYNVVSNPISLRVFPPEQITDISYLDDSLWPPINGYLTLNDFVQGTGELNKFRLAGGHLLQLRFQKRI